MRIYWGPVAWLVCLISLGCTAGGRESGASKDADKVEPWPREAWEEGEPPSMEPLPVPEIEGEPLVPGVIEELSYSTTICYGRCPAQELIVRRDGSYMYLGLDRAYRKGLYFDRAPAIAALMFGRASNHPFGAQTLAYVGTATDQPFRKFTVLDERGRHYISNYGGPIFVATPQALREVEVSLRQLIDTIPAPERNTEQDTERRRAAPGPVCERYADRVRERCAPLLAEGRPYASCLHHARMANELQGLLDDYDADEVESGCAFMITSLDVDAGRPDFVDAEIAQTYGPQEHAACTRWLGQLFREPEAESVAGECPAWARAAAQARKAATRSR